jgi:hypothetical protein
MLRIADVDRICFPERRKSIALRLRAARKPGHRLEPSKTVSGSLTETRWAVEYESHRVIAGRRRR